MKRKKFLIVITVIIVISIVVSSLTIKSIYMDDEERNHYTIDELGKKIIEKQDQNKPVEEESFLIKDEVTWVEPINLPTFSFYKSDEDSSYKINWSANSNVNLVAVGFKSTDNRPVFFKNISSFNFEPGKKIQIKLPVKKYHSFYGNGGFENKDVWKTVEPYYYLNIISRYVVDMSTPGEGRKIDIVNITTDINVNESNKNFYCNITFNSLSNYFPLPVKWEDVENFGWRNDFFEKNFVYDENDNLLGDLKNNRSWENTEIKAGQRIHVEGNYSNLNDPTEDIVVFLNVYSFPSHLRENSTKINIIPPISIDVSG